MNIPEANEQVLYIPADEKRRAGAQDVYQTAARLRPVLKEVFKTGGMLDNFTLGDPDIEDHDSLNSSQRVAGIDIEQMFGSRAEGVAYVTAEVGYLRHIPNFSPTVDQYMALLISATREIALTSSIYLDLPRTPAVTFDPVQVPPPNTLLYLGLIEFFEPRIEPIEPLKTYKDNDDVVQPLLVWKLDPYPSYWSDHNDSPASRMPFYQGDLLVTATDSAESLNTTAQTLVFAQSHSEEYRELVRSQIGT